MATGTKIKDAEHLSVPADDTKIPVSDGSGTPKHITMADIKSYLAEEYAPQWTDATCAISCTKSGIATTMEVGSDKPTTSDFSTSGSTAKAVSAAGTATGGALQSSSVVISTSTDTQLVATGIRIYAAGTTVVKSSKGNATNKTASNSTTALSKATSNSNIDATAYTIKQISRSATYTIKYTNYRYMGAISSLPTTTAEILSAIKGVSKEFSTVATLPETSLAANKYYIFAVVGTHTFKIVHTGSGGEVSAAKEGTISVPRVNGSGSDTYSYIVVPASETSWKFDIE